MAEIITWSQARELGLPNYFSGIPCKRGHVAERTFSSGMCKQCASEKSSAYTIANKDRLNKNRRIRNQADLATTRAKRNAWRARNLEKALEMERRAKDRVIAKDPDRYRMKTAQWAKDNPEKARINIAARRARQVAAEGSFTTKDVSALFRKQKGLCAYCFIKVGKNYHIDHILPLVRGGTNWPDNLQICRKPCNLSKGSKDHAEFVHYRARAA